MKFLLATLCIFLTNSIFAEKVYMYKNALGQTVIVNREIKDQSFQLIKATEYPDTEIPTYEIEPRKPTRQITINKDGSISEVDLKTGKVATIHKDRIIISDD